MGGTRSDKGGVLNHFKETIASTLIHQFYGNEKKKLFCCTHAHCTIVLQGKLSCVMILDFCFGLCLIAS